jgi:hypothetical protein
MTATTIPLAFVLGSGMVQDWQIVAIAVTVLLAVLSFYGAVIKRNYDAVSTLKQRLLGTDGDDTDEGFIEETQRRFDEIEGKMDRHSRQTHRQLYAVDKKVNLLVDAISESNVDGTLEKESLDDVPDPDGRDFLRGGSSDSPSPDGGRPLHRDNPQENSHERDES